MCWSSSKVAVIRVRFYWNFEISQQIFEKYSNIKFNLKILPVEAELFHADRPTDRQTGRYGETNGSFSQNWERANKICTVWRKQWTKRNTRQTLALSTWGRSMFCNCKPKGEFLRTAKQDGGRTQNSLAKWKAVRKKNSVTWGNEESVVRHRAGSWNRAGVRHRAGSWNRVGVRHRVGSWNRVGWGIGQVAGTEWG